MWPCSACAAASASSDSTRSCSVSPMPTRIPLVNGIFSSPAAADRLQAPRRVLGRRARVHRSPSAARTPTRASAPATRSPRAAARDPRARARRGWCAASRPRSSARSHAHTTYAGEVLVPVLAQPLAHLGVDLRALAGQHQELLDLPARRAVEDLEHLLGRVQVRRVGGERAVLAVAPARPRQRQRQVAREGDPAAHHPECMTSGRPSPGSHGTEARGAGRPAPRMAPSEPGS